jgi:hypothetical protein
MSARRNPREGLRFFIAFECAFGIQIGEAAVA